MFIWFTVLVFRERLPVYMLAPLPFGMTGELVKGGGRCGARKLNFSVANPFSSEVSLSRFPSFHLCTYMYADFNFLSINKFV